MKAYLQRGLGAAGFCLLLALGTPARADHILFENVRINGQDAFSNRGATYHVLNGAPITFSADVYGRDGAFHDGAHLPDTLSFLFHKIGGTATVPTNAEVPFITGEDGVRQTISITRAFDGAFDGSVFVDEALSVPSYLRPDNGTPTTGFTFQFKVDPLGGPAPNVPEGPSALLFLPGIAAIGLFTARRKRAS